MKRGKWKREMKKLVLCFVILFAGVISGPLINAGAVDIGTNPTPKVDIAVSVPNDYPGTFLDFKEELTQKLIDQGMNASDFRITDTKVTIDTTDLNGWYVYDHYYNTAAYNNLSLSEDQKKKQPYRAADNTHTTGSAPVYMNNLLANGNISGCRNFSQHIWSYADAQGKASIVFAGYGTQALMDYMIYPAANDTRRTISFDIDANAIGNHTLAGYGFLLNAGIENGRLIGYVLYFNPSHSGNIQKINLDANAGAISGTVVAGSSINVGLTSTKKARLTVELNKDKVTVQTQQYDAAGNLSEPQTKLKDIPLENTGYNGFGPVVGYASHGCSELTVFRYLDLEMAYEASAFDALKNVQYYQGAEYKYFVNLVGNSGDPGIPEEVNKNGGLNESYRDGINRMNENEIFYLSNVDDGQIVTDSDQEDNHQGLGSQNGYIASGDDYVGMMAQYITTNFNEGHKFNQAEVSSDIPLANFYMKDTETDQQIMTIHLQHLVNAGEGAYVPVNFVDKSRPGKAAGADGKIIKWKFKVTDPDNSDVYDSGWVTDPNEIKDYEFTKNSKSGRWTFTLTVKDQKGESKDSQTYLVAFLDDKVPFITGENTGRNIATITLTDTGMGIDEDGITFIEDGRGSGVEAYWITNDNSATPTDQDWEVLSMPLHTYSFEYEIDSNKPLIVWTKDECGNVGNKAVFQPVHVIVEDVDGNPIDDYYVIDDKPIIVLPDDDDIPPSDDEEEGFSGWVMPDGTPITPGTETPSPEDNTITIRPSYSKDRARIVYVANGGVITSAGGTDMAVSNAYEVTSGSSIQKKISEQKVSPSRHGYTFAGWKLLDTGDTSKIGDTAYINAEEHLLDVSEARALCVKNEDGIMTKDTYYLIAQWEVGTYNLRLNANGGSLGNKRIFENVEYGTNIGTLEIPTDGRGIPTKPGYIFKGWSETSGNDISTIFKGVGNTSSVAAPSMPASDKTIYAVWEKDSSKIVVSFDSRGGNRISDHAYGSADTSYKAFTTPQRAGYTFKGWYPVDDSGNIEDTAYIGGEPLIKKVDHSFVAKWEARDDTSYTVDYYVNSGNKDIYGNYTYVRVTSAGVSKTYRGTTETTASVAEQDMLAELSIGGADFWYNPDNANNLLSGKIAGNPALSLRLYYDRYFNVTASHQGHGTVTGALKQKEGSNPTVTWKADEGWQVSKVVIDGVIRDDLLSVGQFTYKYPSGIHEDHKVYVEFSQGTKKPAAVEKYYEIKTSVVGCADESKYDITPMTSMKAGTDHQVTWEIKDSRYRVVSVEVDGIPYEGTDNTVTFTGIQADHSVVVTLDLLPTIGGGTSEGQYTITVNRYGGDDKVKVSSSQIVNAGDSAKVWWDVTDSDYMVYKFMIDGEEIALGHGEKTTTKTYSRKPFTNVTANHVVDIYLTTPKEVDTIPPSFSEEDNIQVTTQFIGAPGSITGGAVLAKNSNYNVNWNVAENKNISLKVNDEGKPVDANGNVVDVNAEGYAFYEVEKVVVNGKEVEPDAQGKLPDSVSFKNLQNDASVQVYVKPVLHRVTILKYGEGEVSSSKTVYHLQDYKNLVMKPADGWATARIEVDGNIQDFLPEAASEAYIPEAASEAYVPEDTPETYMPEEVLDAPSEEEAEASLEQAAISEENTAELQSDETEEDIIEPQSIEAEDNMIEFQADSQEENNTLALGNVFTARAELAPESYEGFEGIEENHLVIVYFTRKDADGNPTPVPESLHKVSVDILGGEGEVEGECLVTDGGETEVTWKIDGEKYEITGFTINGQTQEVPGDGRLALNNITEDKHIEITLSPRKLDGNDAVPPADFRIVKHVINTIIHGGNGIIQGGGEVIDGSDRRISWSLTDEGTEIKYVFVNGQRRDDLKDKEELLLSQIREDQTVVVIVGRPDQPPVNVDKDGDGKPDINIDTDDDGKPDINIDTDGDGEPDINIDTDGDGKPDTNIDADGDGKPDTNIDTDKDKDPDNNTGNNGNGEPDTNKTTDGTNGSEGQQASKTDNPVTKNSALPVTGDEGFGVYGWIAVIDLFLLILFILTRKQIRYFATGRRSRS